MSMLKVISEKKETQSSVHDSDLHEAMRNVITYTIADAFDTAEDETFWISYHIDRILLPIKNEVPRIIPVPVLHEMRSGIYAQRIAQRNGRPTLPRAVNPDVASGSLDDWCTVFSEMVRQCYSIREMKLAEIDGGIRGVLAELGVGHEKNPRAGRYLPNAVKYVLSHKD